MKLFSAYILPDTYSIFINKINRVSSQVVIYEGEKICCPFRVSHPLFLSQIPLGSLYVTYSITRYNI